MDPQQTPPAKIGGSHWQYAVFGVVVYAFAYPFFDELFGQHSRNAARAFKKRMGRPHRD